MSSPVTHILANGVRVVALPDQKIKGALILSMPVPTPVDDSMAAMPITQTGGGLTVLSETSLYTEVQEYGAVVVTAGTLNVTFEGQVYPVETFTTSTGATWERNITALLKDTILVFTERQAPLV